MERIFLAVLNMSLTASWLVLGIVLLRKVFKKLPKAVHCLLWGLVAIRLLFPLPFESAWSLIPSAEPIPPTILYSSKPTIDSGMPLVNELVNPIIRAQIAQEGGVSVNLGERITEIAAIVWIIGVIGMAIYGTVSYWLVRRSVRISMKIEKNVYLCDAIPSPFILGIIRPKIYLPSCVDGEQVGHILAHEYAHLKRRDHWWKPLGFALLAVHWFNPLLWVAYILLCRDIELACDEAVVRRMSGEAKKAYSETLLACSMPRRRLQVCPLAFGEVGVKERIRSVLHYKKPTFWLLLIGVVACMALTVFFMTNPLSETYGTIPQIEGTEFDFAKAVEETKSLTLQYYNKKIHSSDEDETLVQVLHTVLKARVTKKPVKPEETVDWVHAARAYGQDAELFCLQFDEAFRWMRIVYPDETATRHEVENPAYLQALFETLNASIEAEGSSDIVGISVQITAADLLAEEPYLVLEWKNETEEDFYYGEAFDLQRLENDKWISCAKGTMSFIEIAHVLPAQASVEQRYALDGFDLSMPGIYRIYIEHGSQGVLWDAFRVPFVQQRDTTYVSQVSMNVEKYVFGDSATDRATLTLDRYLKRFTFAYSTRSSYVSTGTYTLSGGVLTLTDKENEKLYVFEESDDGFVFDAGRSAELPRYRYEENAEETKECVPDGAGFRKMTDRSFTVETAWAGYSDVEDLRPYYSNGIYGMVRQLAIRRIQSEWGIEMFRNTYDRKLNFAESQYGAPSFDEVVKNYDDEWFRTNTLLVVYVPAGSSNVRYTVESLAYDEYRDEILNVYVKTQTEGEAGNTVMCGYWLLVGVSNEFLSDSFIEEALLDVHIPEKLPEDVTDENAADHYKSTLINLYEDYDSLLDLENEAVAKKLEIWKNNTRKLEQFKTDPVSIMREFYTDFSNLFPFRTRGAKTAPKAPDTYEEAKEYILREFHVLCYDEEKREEIERIVGLMATQNGTDSESDYADTPQENFDWARAYIYAKYVGSFAYYLEITQ